MVSREGFGPSTRGLSSGSLPESNRRGVKAASPHWEQESAALPLSYRPMNWRPEGRLAEALRTALSRSYCDLRGGTRHVLQRF